uniref:Uncharacterized protein n=1 Tax=Klebsiella pneumoniae TaxID=573 RepID=A0A8B0SS71_KLEPN|nr:hypothetical protein [Klebsiella pneumoniae]
MSLLCHRHKLTNKKSLFEVEMKKTLNGKHYWYPSSGC